MPVAATRPRSVACLEGAPGTPARPRRPRVHALYLLPALGSLCIWVYGPLAAAVVLSLLHWSLSYGPATFAGLANYRALFADPDFAQAAWQTLLYAAGMLPLGVGLPLLLAVVLWKHPGRAASAYRYLLFVPMVLAPVATAMSWQFMLNPLQGALHSLCAALDMRAPDWLGDPHTALWAIDVISAGKVIGLNVLLFGAALAGVDLSTVEAARLDGAGERQVTWRVVVPQLSRSMVLIAMLTAVYAAQWSFTNIAVLTQGGPQHSSSNIYYLLYTYGFTYFDIGRASAGAVLAILALAVPLGFGMLLRRGLTR